MKKSAVVLLVLTRHPGNIPKKEIINDRGD